MPRRKSSNRKVYRKNVHEMLREYHSRRHDEMVAERKKYMPMVMGAIIAFSFILIGLKLPGLGPALPSTMEMWIIMVSIMIIGVITIIYSALKVLPRIQGDLGNGISFIIGGLILFVAVTILDTPIHTNMIEFSLLTHTLWHITELVGVIMIGLGLHRVSKEIAV
jgi:hypothetical protein